jgi:hypothetical protein
MCFIIAPCGDVDALFLLQGEEETNSNAVVFFLPLEFAVAQTLTPTNLLGFSIYGEKVYFYTSKKRAKEAGGEESS